MRERQQKLNARVHYFWRAVGHQECFASPWSVMLHAFLSVFISLYTTSDPFGMPLVEIPLSYVLLLLLLFHNLAKVENQICLFSLEIQLRLNTFPNSSISSIFRRWMTPRSTTSQYSIPYCLLVGFKTLI